MIQIIMAAALWFRDVRRIGRELEYQEREHRDPYGLNEPHALGWGTSDYLERKDLDP